jgi:hypothetical protein
MTYDEAVVEIRARYNAGEREFRVSPSAYKGYQQGLTCLTRYDAGAPTQTTDIWLAFKDAKVRMQS